MDLNYQIDLDEFLGIFVPILIYWVYSGVLVLLSSLFEEYRLHSIKEEEQKNLVSKATVIKTVLIQQVLQAMVAWACYVVRGKDDTVHTAIDNKDYFKTLAGQFIVAMLVFDAWMYFMHRIMHQNKFLYKHIHSHHHRLIVPYAFGSQYNHLFEGFVAETLGGAIAFLVSGMSARASIFFFSFAVLKGVDDHCGLWFPGNPFHIFFNNNSAYHDLHHQYGTCNYSQPFFMMWDRLLGTHMPYSLEKRVDGGFIARPTR